jgi:hypothetical protein
MSPETELVNYLVLYIIVPMLIGFAVGTFMSER